MNQSNSSQNGLLFNLVRQDIVKKIKSSVIMTITVFTTIITLSYVLMNHVHAGYSSHSYSYNNYFSHSPHSPLLKRNGSSNSYLTRDYVSIKTNNTLIPINSHNYSDNNVNNGVHNNQISFSVSNYLTTLANNHQPPSQKLDYTSKIDTSTASSVDESNSMHSNTFDLRNLDVSKYKIATMHVLSDLCPHLLSKEQKVMFSTAFDAKFNKILPESNNPKEIFRNLYTQKDYRLILTKMKNNHHNFSEIENKALCEDIIDYKY